VLPRAALRAALHRAGGFLPVRSISTLSNTLSAQGIAPLGACRDAARRLPGCVSAPIGTRAGGGRDAGRSGI